MNKTLLNTFHNFIPNKIIVCDERDPPWMNDDIKNRKKVVKRKNCLFQSQRKSCNLDFAISKPLVILFRNCLESECFPKEWKKAKKVPVHKKNDKQLIKNYRPVSIMLICSNFFEKVIFKSLFKY